MGRCDDDRRLVVHVIRQIKRIVHMWQSWVEIEQYSVVYFNHVTAFEVLQHRTSVIRVGVIHCVDA